MHTHALSIIPRTTRVQCATCYIYLRLATYDEAVWIQMTNSYDEVNGPIILNDNGVIAVPFNFSLYREA